MAEPTSPPAMLQIEVVYALIDEQPVVGLELSAGACVRDAVSASGLLERYPELALEETPVGIYGERVDVDTPLHDGDRVELYRPLVIDPMEARRARARNQAKNTR